MTSVAKSSSALSRVSTSFQLSRSDDLTTSLLSPTLFSIKLSEGFSFIIGGEIFGELFGDLSIFSPEQEVLSSFKGLVLLVFGFVGNFEDPFLTSPILVDAFLLLSWVLLFS